MVILLQKRTKNTTKTEIIPIQRNQNVQHNAPSYVHNHVINFRSRINNDTTTKQSKNHQTNDLSQISCSCKHGDVLYTQCYASQTSAKCEAGLVYNRRQLMCLQAALYSVKIYSCTKIQPLSQSDFKFQRKAT
jgi:hypothetical protein